MAQTTADELRKALADDERRAAFFQRLIGRVLLVVLANAQRRTPVRTGTLRRSETTRVDGLKGFVGTNVIYAPFAHRRVPFFELAVTDSRSQAAKVLQDEGDAYLKGIAS